MSKAKEPVAEVGSLRPVMPQNGTGAVSVTSQRPSWMAAPEQGESTGLEELSQFILPPRLKVVQKMAQPPYDQLFSPGDVVMTPQLLTVAPVYKDEKGRSSQATTGAGEMFGFAPVYFFPEWVVWNPIETKGTLPAIKERTTDPKSAIAQKARNPQLWQEVCAEMPQKDGKPIFTRYVEHLNFAVVLIGAGREEFAGLPVVLSFFRAEHRAGSMFAGLLKMRKAKIFGCQFVGQVGYRTHNPKGQWWGVDVFNPPGDSGITPYAPDELTYKHMEHLHEELKAAHLAGQVRVDYDENEVVGGVTADASAETEF